ncbi:integrase protein-related [Anaeramoeba flamelloides]|uniref:Integrase protein-related n=1 Tax=Anaeramoeba flamelloides TaxID=1746091 RepID=A0AAV7YXT3_9EUKA|nr:integrase protein-related [Anaeramoeba flamelloides]
MDEKGIWNHHPSRRTYTSIDNPMPYVKELSKNQKDTIAAIVSFKGEVKYLFWIKSKKASKTQRKVSGLNNEIMCDWADSFLKYAKRGDILIMDNLGVHHYSKGVQKIKDQGIEIKYIQPYSATHLSPLDNSVFKILEDKLRSNGGRRFANYFDKIATVNRLWKTITSKQVKNQFKKCELPNCRVKYSNKDDKDDKIILSRLIEDIINREEEREKRKKEKN